MRLTKILTSTVLTLNLAACGQIVNRSDQQPPPNQDPIIAVQNPTGPSTIYGEILGHHSFAVKVNRTVLGINSSDENHYAQIRSIKGMSSPGAYYGLGIGNKGMIGIGLKFDKFPVSSFESMSFKTFEPSSNESCAPNAHVSFLIDLNCDSLNPSLLLVSTPNFYSKKKNTWNQFQIKKDDAIFTTPRGHGRLYTLSQIVGEHEEACFVANDSFDLGMKRDQKIAPFQVVHGNSFYSEDSMVAIDDISLTVSGVTIVEDFE